MPEAKSITYDDPQVKKIEWGSVNTPHHEQDSQYAGIEQDRENTTYWNFGRLD